MGKTIFSFVAVLFIGAQAHAERFELYTEGIPGDSVSAYAKLISVDETISAGASRSLLRLCESEAIREGFQHEEPTEHINAWIDIVGEVNGKISAICYTTRDNERP